MKIKFTTQNAEKVIARFENYGRKVDRHIAGILYRNLFESLVFDATEYGKISDAYACALWNHWAIK